jgi:aryl-alcohol dehydrogenase-like predicted oxidoreductase
MDSRTSFLPFFFFFHPACFNAHRFLLLFSLSGLAECCHHQGVSLLAYSPLAMGLLTGKYTDDLPAVPTPGGPLYNGPAEARLNKYKGRYAEAESRYGPRYNVIRATQLYCKVAREAGMSPVQLALRFVLEHPLLASAVFGATDEAQLVECLGAAGQPLLPEETRRLVDDIHDRYPNPTP